MKLFFKMIKQSLRVKRFYGQSENAVKTQIWIALIVHLLFLILKAMNGSVKRTFSSFCSEISIVLFKTPLTDNTSLWLFDVILS